MSDQTGTDITALRTEIDQLRADVAKIGETLRGIAGKGIADARETVHASTEKAWAETLRHARSVGREIEERPVAASLVALGTGVLLGLLLTGRRQ